MSPDDPLSIRVYSASELRRMPAHLRDQILSAAAERAEKVYLNNPDLTAFDAFDDDISGGMGCGIPLPVEQDHPRK
jgi:hypothetical protein